PEPHRSTGIENEAAPEICVRLELLDVEPVGPPIDPPIQPPEIVARDVFAILRELDARAAVRAGMASGDASLHGPAGREGDVGKSRQNLGVEKGTRISLGKHRAAVCL